MELLFNLLIMGSCVIIIESNFQLFRAITFNSTTDIHIQGATHLSYTRLFVAVVVRLIGGFDFFQAFMQFLMSVTSISQFVEVSGGHDFSPECNAVENFVGYDGNLAFLASCQAWLLLLPVIYEVSKILIPGIPKGMNTSAFEATHKEPVATDEAKKPESGSSIFHVLKYGSIASPDLWLSTLASMWVRAVRLATPLTTTRDKIPLYQTTKQAEMKNETCFSFFFSWCYKEKDEAPVSLKDIQLDNVEEVKHVDGAGHMTPTETKDETCLSFLFGKKLKSLPTEDDTTPSAAGANHRSEEGESQTKKSLFRVVSCGEMSKGEMPCGLYFALPGYSKKVWSSYNDLHVAKNAYHFCVIDRISGEIESLKAYDIIGDGCASQENKELIALVDALKAFDNNKIVVVFTTGMPGTPHPLEGEALGEALNLCGGTDKFFTAIEKYSAYVLIGIPGIGTGTGHEVIIQPGGKAANIDLSFEITANGFAVLDIDQEGIFDNSWCCSNQSYIFAAFQKRTDEENKKWKEERGKRMPSYYTLCCRVHEQLFKILDDLSSGYLGKKDRLVERMSWFIALLMTICGVGHFFTEVGREVWYYIMWKYHRFILLCLGYWTDDIVEIYDIHKHVHEMSTVGEKPFKRKSKEAYVVHQRKLRGAQDAKEVLKKSGKPRKQFKDYFFSLPAWMTPDGGWIEDSAHEETDEMIEAQQEVLKRKLRADYAAAIHAAVATRAVLLQVVPFLSYLSIYATIMSATPITVHSKLLASNLPELIISEPFVEARAQEQESIDGQEWIRTAIFTVDQNSIPNPEYRMVEGKPPVEVSNSEREEIEKINKNNRDRMKKIIDSLKPRVDEWIIAINGTIMNVTESRGIKFLLNLCKFILTVGITLTPQDKMKYWMAASVIVFTPLCFFAALGIVAFVGKLFHITDDDLEAALGCVGMTCFYKRLVRYTGGPERVSTGSGGESKV